MFYKDFKNNFKTHQWYDLHKAEQRHHINDEDGIKDDIDLIDVIQHLVDGVMAGIARSGKYIKNNISQDLLQKAFNNSVDKLLKNIQIEE